MVDRAVVLSYLRQPRIAASLVAGAVILVLLGRCAFSGDEQPEMLTAPVTRGDVERSVTALGTVQPKDYVDVGAQVSGQLTQLLVDIGDNVKKGDLLGVIDPKVIRSRVEGATAELAALEAQLAEQQAQVDLARSQSARSRQLKAVDAISQNELESAAATLKGAEARRATLRAQIDKARSTLKETEANLGYTNIYAPMSGTVVSKSAFVGQTLNANQQAPIILRLADLKTMTIWADVAEADVVKLKVGMPAYFTTLGAPGRRWRSKIRQLLPTPKVVNDVILYNVLLDARNPDASLLPQMTAQVFFTLEQARNVLIVPLSALQPIRGGRAYQVQTLIRGKPVTKPVKVGVQSRTHAQIIEGLKEGDEVVLGLSGAGAQGGDNAEENNGGGDGRGGGPGGSPGGGRGRGSFRGGVPL